MIVLDTSALVELTKGSSRGSRVNEELAEQQFLITAITLHEFSVGSDKQLNVPVLDFTSAIVRHSVAIEQNLMKRGTAINKMDILIAGTCIAHNATLVTCDRDFKKIRGLKVKVIG